MAPFDLSRLANMDFVASLTGNRLAFKLLQNPELVEIDKIHYSITRDTWVFSGPDTRSFPVRLLDCFKLTGSLYYQKAKVVAFNADRIQLRLPKKFLPDAPLCQEQAWSAWLLADAARQAIKKTDDEKIRVKLPIYPLCRSITSEEQQANILLEREQTLVDALLLRFCNIAELAPVPEGKEAKEVTAAQNFQLKVETAGLIRAAEDLMSLSRELKEMWLFGPLRSLNEGEAKVNARIEEDARAVAAILDSIMKSGNGEHNATEEKSTEEKSTEAKEDEAQAGKEDGGEDHEA